MFQSKSSKLIAGIVLDLLGMASVPLGFTEVLDLGWAPIAGYLMTKLYPGKAGVAAGVLTTVEELLPGMDIIPSFTIMWCYTYLIKGGIDVEDQEDTTTIEVNHK